MVTKLAALLVCMIPAFTSSLAHAGGDLLVTPTRLVMEGRNRAAEIGLVNTGKETATYRISLVNQRMTRMGAFERVTTATSPTGEWFAANLVRYFPRQVVLQPGESQTVRLEVRKPANLKEGEYRSHMLFRAVPTEASKLDGDAEDTGINIRLNPIYGLSIPIIVRHGKTSAKVTLEKPRLESGQSGGPPFFVVTLRRSGSSSVYGNLTTTYIAPDGTETRLTEHSGVAVYTPNEEREMRIEWDRPPGLANAKGQIRFTFADAASLTVLTQADLKLK